MKTIRSKLILILIVIVLLPLLPIVWLVNGLVQQSYRIGVNPQVEAALGSGVEYSRELYRIRKEHLLEALSQAFSPQTVQLLLQNSPFPAENFRLRRERRQRPWTGGILPRPRKRRRGKSSSPIGRKMFSSPWKSAAPGEKPATWP